VTDERETTGEPAPRVSARRRTIIIAIAIVAALAGAAAYTLIRTALESSPTLTAYVSETGNYEVSGPGTPSVVANSDPIDGVPVTQTQTSWKTKSTYFVVATAPIPGGSPSDLDSFFDDTLNGMVTVFAGSEVNDRNDSSLDGERALDGAITVDASTTFRYVIAAHNGVQYVLLTSGSSPATEQAFVDSFHFTD
jgi:hypothetical protein